jgi:transposase-like protein
MKQARKHYTPEEKVALLRRHLLEKAPVSDLCQETGLHPSLFYHWLKEFFEHGTAAFEHRSRGDKQQQEAQQRRIAALEEKLKAKNEVLAELMEEHVALKKSLGEI